MTDRLNEIWARHHAVIGIGGPEAAAYRDDVAYLLSALDEAAELLNRADHVLRNNRLGGQTTRDIDAWLVSHPTR